MFDFLKKKKNDSYSLDDTTLPSLSSTQEKDSNFTPGNDSMQSDSLDAPPSFNSENANFQPSTDFSNHPASSDSNDNSQIAEENPFKPQSSFPQTDFSSQNSFSDANNNNPNSSFSSSSDSNSSTVPNESSDMSKIQLETIDKRISLLDTRVSMMEDKINKIYEMISLEVKPETKMKVEMRKTQK